MCIRDSLYTPHHSVKWLKNWGKTTDAARWASVTPNIFQTITDLVEQSRLSKSVRDNIVDFVGSKLDISIQVLLPLHRPWASIFHFIYSNMSLVSPSKLRQWPTSENDDKIRSKIELFSRRFMNEFFGHFLYSWKPHANVLEFFNKSAQVIHFISRLWSTDTLLIIKTSPESVPHTCQN